MEEGREKVVARREVNEWKILHGEENEREEQLNEGGHRDWVAFLMGSMQTGSITEGSWGRYNPYGLMSNYFTIKREWRDHLEMEMELTPKRSVANSSVRKATIGCLKHR